MEKDFESQAADELELFRAALKNGACGIVSDRLGTEPLDLVRYETEAFTGFCSDADLSLGRGAPKTLMTEGGPYREVARLEKTPAAERLMLGGAASIYFSNTTGHVSVVLMEITRSNEPDGERYECTLSWFPSWPDAQRFLLLEMMGMAVSLREALLHLKRNADHLELSKMSQAAEKAIAFMEEAFNEAAATEDLVPLPSPAGS